MDEPPSLTQDQMPQRVPLTWRLRAYLVQTLPRNGRKRIKKLLLLGDAWREAGFLAEADELYRRAHQLAEEARMHHLCKKARKRRSALKEQMGVVESPFFLSEPS